MTLMNRDLAKWCPQRMNIVGIVRDLLPAGIKRSLYSIVERKSDLALINHVTIVMYSEGEPGLPFYAKAFQLSQIMTEPETVEFLVRVATEMYYVRKG